MRRSVQITNNTPFDTAVLRSLILAVARRHLKPTDYKTMKVTVGHPKRNYVTGKALIDKRPSTSTAVFSIFIPKTQTDILEVAERIKVCLEYCYGRHGGSIGQQFNDWWNRKGKAFNHPYAAKMTLTQAAPAPKKIKPSGAVLSLKKAEAAQDKVIFWEAKVKRATTMLKKWQKLLKYHSTRGEKLHLTEAEKLEKTQGMTVEEFMKMAPVLETGQ